jgi:hypothetical protein
MSSNHVCVDCVHEKYCPIVQNYGFDIPECVSYSPYDNSDPMGCFTNNKEHLKTRTVVIELFEYDDQYQLVKKITETLFTEVH